MRIDVTDARKAFDGVFALDGVSFHVPPGGRVALAGPNGSGKSTLIRGVMGLVRCDGVRLDGLDPLDGRIHLAPRIAYVPQSAPLMSASVREVMGAVAALRGIEPAAIVAVAAALQLDARAIASRPVRALSGGMKQKLLIALALAAPASLFVLDEPTASLDTAAREAFFDLFAQRSSGATVLLSSHRADEVRELVDRVITLESGRVVADQTASGWLARDDSRRACA